MKEGRIAAFRDVPGLVQAFFLEARDVDEIAAFFVFDSEESLETFLASDLVAETPEVMKVQGDLKRGRFEVTETLHEQV